MRNPLANCLTGHAVDQYINQIETIIASSPANGQELLTQLQAFDDAAQSQRMLQPLRLFANVRLSSESDVQLIDEALAAV